MNNILLVVAIIVTFSLLLITKKFFGKYGLIAWMGIASILAEIMVTKSVNFLGMSGTLGNVMFASNFLATDMLTECYGEKYAKKGVFIGIWSVVVYLLCSQLMLLFVPNEIDMVHDSMKNIFSITPRICISSVIMFSLANYVDVKLYAFLKKKFGDKKMWFRNNFSTIICNGTENFLFVFFAFIGVYPIKEVLIIGLSTTLIETIIALCDTPFLYLSKKVKDIE